MGRGRLIPRGDRWNDLTPRAVASAGSWASSHFLPLTVYKRPRYWSVLQSSGQTCSIMVRDGFFATGIGQWVFKKENSLEGEFPILFGTAEPDGPPDPDSRSETRRSRCCPPVPRHPGLIPDQQFHQAKGLVSSPLRCRATLSRAVGIVR